MGYYENESRPTALMMQWENLQSKPNNFYNMKSLFKRASIMMALLILCVPILADTFQKGNLIYKILSGSTCEVVDKNGEVTDVIIPSEVTYNEKTYSVTAIRDCAFQGCTSLESFTFGTGLKSIGYFVFDNCSAMTRLVAGAQVPPVCEDRALQDINKGTCKLYVPVGQVEAYKAAEGWREFWIYGNIIETGIESLNRDDATEVERFSLDGTRLKAPQKGINIVRMSDGTTYKVMVK